MRQRGGLLLCCQAQTNNVYDQRSVGGRSMYSAFDEWADFSLPWYILSLHVQLYREAIIGKGVSRYGYASINYQ